MKVEKNLYESPLVETIEMGVEQTVLQSSVDSYPQYPGEDDLGW